MGALFMLINHNSAVLLELICHIHIIQKWKHSMKEWHFLFIIFVFINLDNINKNADKNHTQAGSQFTGTICR